MAFGLISGEICYISWLAATVTDKTYRAASPGGEQMRYEITISHEGMNKIRRISGADKWLVEEKARAQKATWDEQWAIRVEKERQRSSRERAAFVKDSKKKLALDRTEEAQGILTELRSVLGARKKSLKIWSKLKDTASFSEPAPIEPATW